MNLRFCDEHDQALHRALTSRGLTELGWCTDQERKTAIAEQSEGSYTPANFNPFVQAIAEIFMYAGDQLGDQANGCPICLLQDDQLIDQTADKMTAIARSLPDD
jgi:hypothetical protein